MACAPRPGLAIGLINHPVATKFTVFAAEPPVNVSAATIEFSRSLNPHPVEPANTVVTPLFRRGHVVQARQGLHPDFPEVRMLELSYPALKGASGAPVFREDALDVIGVIVANIERELMPAQVLRAVRDDGEPIEEIRYFLPNALAVSSIHLVEILLEQSALAV